MLSINLYLQNLTNKLKKLRFSNHLAPICFIILLGLIPLSYFGSGKIILGGDTGYQLLSPVFQIQKCSEWDTVHAFGYYNPTYPLLLSYLIPLGLLSVVNVLPFISDAILLSFFLVSSGLSMYFLTGTLYTKKNMFATVAAVSSATFYMFNAYSLEQWSAPDFAFLSAYAMYPLMFALFVRGVKSEKYVLNGILLALGSLIFTAGNGNFCFSVILFFTLFCYTAFYLLTSKNNIERFRALRFILVAVALYLLVNLWWILPLINSYGEMYNMLAVSSPYSWLTNFSSYSSILHLFQLYGYPGWEASIWGKPQFPYVSTLVYNPFFILLSFTPLILFGIAILFEYKNQTNNQKRTILFLSIFYLISIFLSKGVQPPFGAEFYSLLFKYIPPLVMFRSGFFNLGIMIALSLAILFGISLDVLYQLITTKVSKSRRYLLRKSNAIFAITFISLILVSSYPFFTGQVVISGEGALPSFHHTIPDYYYETGNWFKNQTGDFNLFSLSSSGTGWVVYNFGGGDIYIGGDIDSYLLQRPIVSFQNNALSSEIYSSLLNNQTEYIGKLLNLLNVKYLILHDDVDLSFYGGISPETIKASLQLQKDICLEKTFGKIEIYLNTDYKEMSVYTTNQFQFNENLTILPSEINQSCVNQPNITFQEINPTLYDVHIINATCAFSLILSQSYSDGWVATINGQQIHSQYHFLANDYANGWYINKTGTYTITLEFTPQNLFYAGVAILITTLILCTVYASKNRIKSIYKNYIKKRD